MRSTGDFSQIIADVDDVDASLRCSVSESIDFLGTDASGADKDDDDDD
eukprot:CAMPEP_0170439848 /NCGR_PEP_ID=MMETSP0117_2-20130122/46007_1 /TAXON_ID=400756 /ORGANISM="Durinskia baltica, Strain CSIRO CS-38" /LENGTH=47 /DNA_ID= /DNA_START= /DNA_END= /DNA_ORIENTATION=